MRVTIKQGLDVPVQGRPEQTVYTGPAPRAVALLGGDYVGLKPRMLVAEGDRVARGQPLFADKANPGVTFASPGGGVIEAINRGARRVLLSVVVRLDEQADAAPAGVACDPSALAGLDPAVVRGRLLSAGLWTALRARPFSRIPQADAAAPRSIFVTAIDTQPLALDPAVVIAAEPDAFAHGLAVLGRLTEGPLYVCVAGGVMLPASGAGDVRVVEFAGPHPAGLAGTHIHFVDPVAADRQVWHIGYQDVIAAGKLFTTGQVPVERTVALGGPVVRSPRLVTTRLGARISDLTAGELDDDQECRVISGSVLSGRRATSSEGYLGRYHTQISAIAEERRRHLFGWLGLDRSGFTFAPTFRGAASASPRAMTSAQHGRPCAQVPIGAFERVMPLDILPVHLLRALLVKDTDSAQALGALELDEEDLALASFVCPGKNDYGAVLRANLDRIERDG